MQEPIPDAGWIVVGRPGLFGRAGDRRRREYDERFGADRWRIRHRIRGQILDRASAALGVVDSYVDLLTNFPRLLDWLCGLHADVFENARSNLRSEQDYAIQERKGEHIFDIALRRALKRLGRRFLGEEYLRIGGRSCLEMPVSPGRVPFIRPGEIAQPVLKGWWLPDSVAAFWESNKLLEVIGSSGT